MRIEDGTGTDRAVGVNTENRLLTDSGVSSDFFFNVASGDIPGISQVNKFGVGTVAGAADETIWDGSSLAGITGYTYIATPSTLYLSSDAAGDDQVYEVQGLDGNYCFQKALVTASGFTFVAIAGTWLRVFRAKNLGVTNNAGNIYVSDDNTDVGGNGIPDTLTNVKAMVTLGQNQTLMAIYTVPAGRTAYMIRWLSSVGKGDDVETTLWFRSNNGVFQIKDHHHVYQTEMLRPFVPYLKIEQKTDIEIKGHIGAAGGETSAGFDLILVDN